MTPTPKTRRTLRLLGVWPTDIQARVPEPVYGPPVLPSIKAAIRDWAFEKAHADWCKKYAEMSVGCLAEE